LARKSAATGAALFVFVRRVKSSFPKLHGRENYWLLWQGDGVQGLKPDPLFLLLLWPG
jgi:hypothetical protein